MNSIWSRVNIIASLILYPRHSSNRGELSERPTTRCCTARRSVPWMAMGDPYPKGIWRRWPRWEEGASGETKSQSTGNQGSELYADAVMTAIGDVKRPFCCNEARPFLFILWLLLLMEPTVIEQSMHFKQSYASFSFHPSLTIWVLQWHELRKWRWYMPVYYRTKRPTRKKTQYMMRSAQYKGVYIIVSTKPIPNQDVQNTGI